MSQLIYSKENRGQAYSVDDRRESIRTVYTSAENRRTDYEIRQNSKLSNVALTFGMEEEVRMGKFGGPLI